MGSNSFTEGNGAFSDLVANVPAVFYNLPIGVSEHGGVVGGKVFDILGFELKGPDSFWDTFYNVLHPADRESTIAKWEAARDKGEDFSIECRLYKSENNFVWLLNEGTFVKNENGVVVGQSGVIVDICARKRVEETLRAREERFRKITECMSDYVFTVLVENGQVVETIHGGACQPITGYSPQEFNSNPNLWLEMVHQHDRGMIAERARCMACGEDVPQVAHRIIHKNGQTRWVHSIIVPHRNEDGVIIFYDGVIRDITEQKREQQKVEQESFMNQMLLDAIPYAAILIQEDGEVISTNSAGEEMGAECGKSWNLLWEEMSATLECAKTLQQAMTSSEKKVTEIHALDKFYEVTFVPMEPDLCICTFYDITQRQLLSDFLTEDKLIVKALMENTVAAIYILDTKGRFENVNEVAANLLDISPAEIIGLSIREVFRANDSKRKMKAIDDVIATRKMARISDSIGDRKLDTLIIPVLDDISNPTKVIILSRDETDRINSGKKLLEAYQMLTSLVEHMPVAVVTLDKEYRIKLWSPVAEKESGLRAQDVYGKKLEDLLEEVPQEFLDLLEIAKTEDRTERVTINFKLKNGSEVPARINVASIVNAEGEVDGTIVMLEREKK